MIVDSHSVASTLRRERARTPVAVDASAASVVNAHVTVA